jgi:putative nucleotidyltransferase with HDIG domain
MIDIKRAKQELKKYVSNYDIEDKKIKLKIAHIERTASIAKKIAESLKLDTEDVQLAELIGLLHDIGRFEQIKRYNTFIDKNSVNHGELGAQILFEEGIIRNFIEDSKYDEIIKKSILNHNKGKKDLEFSNEKEELHSKIIRDADKIDIIYILTFEEKEVAWEKADFSKEKITDEIYREFIEDKAINYKERKTAVDTLVSHFAFIYDFNYKYSLQIIKEKGYFEKIYKRFKFENKETEDRINYIYKMVEKYLEGV